MKKNVVAFIPVRGESKSIPLKNIKLMAGKPLVYWTIEAALNCLFIDKVYVCTDSAEIRNCVQKIQNPKLHIIGRRPETATDEASSEMVLLDFCQDYEFGHVFFIQATSPLLTSADLLNAWEIYSEKQYDSLLSVVRQKRFLWQEAKDRFTPLNYDLKFRPRRQDFPGFLVENGAFYLSKRENIIKSKCRLSGSIGVYEMSDESYFEIDEPIDFTVVEIFLNDKNKMGNTLKQRLDKIKLLITDVDGVLTDSGMYYTEHGDELKKFNTKDGKGLELLRRKNVKTAIITSENTAMVERRAKKLHIDYLRQGIKEKKEAILEIIDLASVLPDEVIYIGDDVNDLPAISIAGLSACPYDAVEAVKQKADIILKSMGGKGAIREVCEMILHSKEP